MNKESESSFLDRELCDIIAGVQSGDEESFALLKTRYAPLICALCRSFNYGVSSPEDLEKEAQTALLKAALHFDTRRKKIAFGLYAKICIKNALISLRRKELSRKRRQSRESGEPQRARARVKYSPSEQKRILEAVGDSLSPYEKRIFCEYMADRSIDEIAETVGRPKKSVFNAVYRIKGKIKRLIPPEK